MTEQVRAGSKASGDRGFDQVVEGVKLSDGENKVWWTMTEDWSGVPMRVLEGDIYPYRISEVIARPMGTFWMSEFWERFEEMAGRSLIKAVATRIKKILRRSGIFFDPRLVVGYKKSWDSENFMGEYDAYVRPEMVGVFFEGLNMFEQYGWGEWSDYGFKSHEFVGEVVRSLVET